MTPNRVSFSSPGLNVTLEECTGFSLLCVALKGLTWYSWSQTLEPVCSRGGGGGGGEKRKSNRGWVAEEEKQLKKMVDGVSRYLPPNARNATFFLSTSFPFSLSLFLLHCSHLKKLLLLRGVWHERNTKKNEKHLEAEGGGRKRKWRERGEINEWSCHYGAKTAFQIQSVRLSISRRCLRSSF